MKVNNLGQIGYSENEIANLLRVNPELDISLIPCLDPSKYNTSIQTLYLNVSALKQWKDIQDTTPEAYHDMLQKNWHMPAEYKDLDIVKYLTELCNTFEELQRVQQELELYQQYNLFDLLKFLKYIVDTFRQNNIIMGVGRGSSVSSFILYKMGVHKINSLQYQLDIHEFLRSEY